MPHTRRSRARLAAATAAVLTAGALAACGGGSSGGPATLSWYINPDASGSTPRAAAECSAQSGGRYRIAISVLPATADGQREQLVRRLAAGDPSIDIMMVDPPYTAELANAGWLRPFTASEGAALLPGILRAPIESAAWKGRLVAIPYSANTQLLWYRKSVAQRAGVDPTAPGFTWDQMIDAALKTGTTVAEQGRRYEGYMVWVNVLVLSGGGEILTNNERGRDATPSIDSPGGREAVRIIRRVATSRAADAQLSTADEEAVRAAFQGPRGGFMLNWPYVYAAMQSNVKDGSLDAETLADVGWARYPRVRADLPSKPPIGGANLAIGRFSRYPDLARAAIQCLISPPMLKIRMLGLGDPVANGTLYDDPAVRAKYPMADLIRESINAAGPRPVTPYYGDVSAAIQRDWHPPSSVDPNRTPARSARLISDVLHDKRLL